MKGFAAAPRFPLPSIVMVLACAIYLIVGSVGHDPWKTDDALHIGVAFGFFSGGDWLIPRIAGEAWLGVTPLFHWLAAITGWLTQWALPFHDGARLASALFGALLLYLLARTAAALYDRDAGLAAPLLAIGTIGLLVPIHDAQPAVAVLAASALAYLGLAISPPRPLLGMLALGLGIGLSVLAGGLSGALPLLPLLLLPVLQRQWFGFVMALAAAAAVGSTWPAALTADHANHLLAWWNAQRSTMAVSPQALNRDHLELLGWFAWPVLPIALWSAWLERHHWREWNWLVPLTGTLSALIWFLLHEARPLMALPLLPPLVLLASAGAHRLRRGAASALDWFGMMTFSLIIGLVWLGGIAMWTGWPARIARNFAKLEPGFEAHFSVAALAMAAAFTTAWLVAVIKLPRSPWRAAIRWAVGVTAMWGVLFALWLPWIDYGKSYREVIYSLQRALPSDAGCIERRQLGLPQRALIDYFAGLHTVPSSRRADCRWLLVQGGRNETVPAGWQKTWEGHRPGDRSERLRLYQRER